MPTRFGDIEWEFGTIIQVFDSLAVPTVAMLFLAMALRLRGGSALTRVYAIIAGIGALMLLALLVLFALDVPVALGALAHPRAGGAPASAVVASGIKRGTLKTFAEGLGYAACYAGLALGMWKAPNVPAS